MKDKHKAIIAIICVYCGIAICLMGLLFLGFRACQRERTYLGHYVEVENGRMEFGVSDEKKDSFAAECLWTGGDMSFTVPDEFGGYKVTKLGGIYGTAPQRFEVRIKRELLEKECRFETGKETFDKHHIEGDEYETLTFTIYIGKNIKEFNLVHPSYYLATSEWTEDGEEIYDFVYKIECYFVVDEKNKTFYSKDGKVYYKENDKRVEWYE